MIPQFVERLLFPLSRFVRVAPLEGLDGFVVQLPSAFGHQVSDLGRTVNQLLRSIAANDPTGEDCMAGDIARPGWHFRFTNCDFFIAAFAPCYPATHARHSFEANGVFVLFQPESSFKNHGLKKDPPTALLRHSIQGAYQAAGRPYTGPILSGNLEAPRYVKPMSPNDPVVEWWLM